MITGTFKYDTETEVYVFRDAEGNTVSWNKHTHLWELWVVGATLEGTFDTLTFALVELSEIDRQPDF